MIILYDIYIIHIVITLLKSKNFIYQKYHKLLNVLKYLYYFLHQFKYRNIYIKINLEYIINYIKCMYHHLNFKLNLINQYYF